jgi:hypothetical protein
VNYTGLLGENPEILSIHTDIASATTARAVCGSNTWYTELEIVDIKIDEQMGVQKAFENLYSTKSSVRHRRK